MGESKVGKTTLLYYLMGKPLLHIKNEMDVYVLQPSELYKEAEVGEDYNSKTLCPNFSTEDEGQIMIIDMPGKHHLTKDLETVVRKNSWSNSTSSEKSQRCFEKFTYV